MRHLMLMITVSSLMACAKPDTTGETKSPAESWQVADTSPRAAVTSPEEMTPATTPREDLPTPIEEDEFRSVYAPGAFSWARPGYRVVFHHAAESERNKQRPDLSPLFDNSSILYETKEGGIYHRLQFLNASIYLGKGARVFPEQVDVKSGSASRWPEYRGVYFPEPLAARGEPTLHLFEQGSGYLERMVYEAENMIITISTGVNQVYHVPRNTLGAEWLKCQTKNGYRIAAGVSEDDPCGAFQKGRTPYGTVAFFEEDPLDKGRSYGHTVEVYISRHHWKVPPMRGGGRAIIEDDEDYGEPVPLLILLRDYKSY